MNYPYWSQNQWSQPQVGYNPYAYYPPGYQSAVPNAAALAGGASYLSPYINTPISPSRPSFPLNLPANLPANHPIRSKKYPTLNPCLASDCSIIHPDLRKKPRSDIVPSTYNAFCHTQAFAYPVTKMRLICKSFPWTIDIVSPTPITVEAVWEAMYTALQQHMHDSEWGMMCQEKKQREMIEKAAENRGKGDQDKRLKRIDWLGETTVFKGLEKSEEFEKVRLFPGSTAVAETWIIKLGTN